MKLRLHLSERSAIIHQEHQTMAILISQAFGGKDDTPDPSAAPKTADEFKSLISSLYS